MWLANHNNFYQKKERLNLYMFNVIYKLHVPFVVTTLNVRNIPYNIGNPAKHCYKSKYCYSVYSLITMIFDNHPNKKRLTSIFFLIMLQNDGNIHLWQSLERKGINKHFFLPTMLPNDKIRDKCGRLLYIVNRINVIDLRRGDMGPSRSLASSICWPLRHLWITEFHNTPTRGSPSTHSLIDLIELVIINAPKM